MQEENPIAKYLKPKNYYDIVEASKILAISHKFPPIFSLREPIIAVRCGVPKRAPTWIFRG